VGGGERTLEICRLGHPLLDFSTVIPWTRVNSIERQDCCAKYNDLGRTEGSSDIFRGATFLHRFYRSAKTDGMGEP
jgi:hypothetical protein